MDATILIVDDEKEHVADNQNYIEEIDQERRAPLGIGEFLISTAESFKDARKMLSHRGQSPFNLVLLDLHLPEPSSLMPQADGDADDSNKFRGVQLLESMQKSGAAEAVIVVSGFPEKMLEVFRKGAADFITKPFEVEELQERFLICWSRLLMAKSKRVFDQRARALVPYAERGLAHRFTNCFSSLIRTVVHSSEDIERHVRERYGLDRQRDGQDFFFVTLDSNEESVSKAKKQWSSLNAPLQASGESSKKTRVETLINDINQSLLPCLIVKNTILDFADEDSGEILTFENDVRAILGEIIVGAVDTVQDFHAVDQIIKIRSRNADGQVKVTFTDRLEPISEEDARHINEGAAISPSPRFGREWGLSVMQHIAMHGGGRLQIEPRSGGNIINYFIPTAQ